MRPRIIGENGTHRQNGTGMATYSANAPATPCPGPSGIGPGPTNLHVESQKARATSLASRGNLRTRGRILGGWDSYAFVRLPTRAYPPLPPCLPPWRPAPRSRPGPLRGVRALALLPARCEGVGASAVEPSGRYGDGSRAGSRRLTWGHASACLMQRQLAGCAWRQRPAPETLVVGHGRSVTGGETPREC